MIIVKVLPKLKRYAKLTRKQVNPHNKCLGCGADLTHSVHHFYCDNCDFAHKSCVEKLSDAQIMEEEWSDEYC